MHHRLVAIVALGAVATTVNGAGFAIIEQGVAGLGNAYAGGAAAAEDPSTVFFNPAGLTRLDGTRVQGAAHIIRPRADFENDRSSLTGALPPPAGGAPLAGGGADGGSAVAVPNLYLTHRIDDRWSAGLGINAPFGLETRYDDDWVGRYHAIDSELRTLNVNPTLAFQASPRLSLGVGLNAQYIEARLTNALDTPTLCGALAAAVATRAGPATAAPLTACAAPGPMGADGRVEVEGEDWSWGWNAGVLYVPTADTRLGLAYRSSIDHTLDGKANFSAIPDALRGAGLFLDSDARADIELPETLSASLWQGVARGWAVMADVTWTRWRRFDELRVAFERGGQGDSVQPENWENTWRVAVGVSYDPNPRWTLRLGAAYDETPIPSRHERTPRIPGNDRVWVAVGASYRVRDDLVLDAGYAHLFVDDTPIVAVEPVTGHRLQGVYDSSVDILSAQARWAF